MSKKNTNLAKYGYENVCKLEKESKKRGDFFQKKFLNPKSLLTFVLNLKKSGTISWTAPKILSMPG